VKNTWRVFENRVLRRLFAAKRDEVAGDWKKLHNEITKLHNLYSSPNNIRMIKLRMGGECSANGRDEICV
jgi:hypothetical protein